MRSFRLLAVAILAVVLALSSAQNAFASAEIFYDTGSFVAWIDVRFVGTVAVRFSLPSGCFSVSGARFYASTGSAGSFMKLHVQSALGVDLAAPITESVSAGWNTYTLATGGISGDFYIAAEYVSAPDVLQVGATGTPIHDRSYWYDAGSGSWVLDTFHDYMIRAEVDPCEAPYGAVGGFMEPVNTLAVLAPWFAVIGLVGFIGTIVVVVKKRRS